MTKQDILDMFKKASFKEDYNWNTYQPINVEGYEQTLNQAGRFCKDRAESIINHVKNNLPKESKFIDWGCNNGYFVFELAKNGYKSIGVDLNKNFISVCNTANESFNYIEKPKFFVDELNIMNIEKYDADVLLCFSVLHHFKNHANNILDKISNHYKYSYIEMDGHNFGFNHLTTFFWDVDYVGSANDKYGKGTRLRKTWFCTNTSKDFTYKNIKNVNILGGRGIFLKTNNLNENKSVIKRELSTFKHSWINTNIIHETKMYAKYKTHFLADMLTSKVDEKYNILELEYIDENSIKGDSLENIYKWLKDNNLFIIDITRDQFIKTKNGYVLVDLESLFPNEQISTYVKKPIPYDTYEKQLQILKKVLP